MSDNKISVPSISVGYARSGASTKSNALGMRAMQERAYEKRGEPYLLIKSPPASGKSRALMFIALDKLHNQGIKQAIVVVPEKSIGASFNDEPLTQYGFHWDWRVEPGSFRLERILPQPGTTLIINLHEDETRVYSDDAQCRCERSCGTVFSGQFTRSFVIDSVEQIAVIGVAFRPAGACAFLRERMDVLGNRHTAFDDLAGPSARALRERLLQVPAADARLALLEG